jgi:hypothetical protein
VVDVLDELLEEVLELLLVLAFGRPQPASASTPATAKRATDRKLLQFIRGRLARRNCGHRTFASSSLVFSGLASKSLHGNMILQRTPNMNFTEAGV